MARMKSTIFAVLPLAMVAIAAPAMQGAQSGDNDAPGLIRPANRLNFRRFPSDPPPCITGQNHSLRRPCSGRPNGGDDNRDGGNDNHDGGNDNHQQGNGGGPAVVVGGTAWPITPNNFDNDGPPNPNHNDSPNDKDGPNAPDPFIPTSNVAATPEPTYVALTGFAFTGLALFARKRRRNRD